MPDAAIHKILSTKMVTRRHVQASAGNRTVPRGRDLQGIFAEGRYLYVKQSGNHE
jgi:hypothetical protein